MIGSRKNEGSLFFYKTSTLIADRLTGVAPMAFILINHDDLPVNLIIHIAWAGVHTLPAIRTFVPINDNLPHLYGALFYTGFVFAGSAL